MSPVRRPEGAPPPSYRPRESKFSVKFNHGGYFVGEGINRSYVDGHVACYDQVDSLTWSPIMVEHLVEEIGWEMAGRVKVYYCIPILEITRNGLREIRTEHDTDQMLAFLGIGHHFFEMYVDHDDSLNANVDADDVVYRPVARLPRVVSPSKGMHSGEGQCSRAAHSENDQQPGDAESEEELVQGCNFNAPLQVVYPEVEAGNFQFVRRKRAVGEQGPQSMYQTETIVIEPSVDEQPHSNGTASGTGHEASDRESQDSDYDPDSLVDSDYDISDDDDDLYADNVDDDEPLVIKYIVEQVPVGKGKGKASDYVDAGKGACRDAERDTIEEYDSEGDELWGPDSDDEVTNKFTMFRGEDLHSPKFFVGQIFDTVEMLRAAIKQYSCKNRVDIKLPINDKKRVKAVCYEDCTWYLWASYDSRSNCFMVKKYVHEHTCTKKWNVTAFTAPFLARKYLESFRADQDMNLRNFSRLVQKKWHMTPGRCKLQRARRVAMKIIYGDEAGQYKLLWDYANEIRRSNPGSSFFVALDENARFNKADMCLDACKRGFLQGCRPVIFLDGCHIKTRFRGQLLAAVGIDPNNCIFPIAIAIVEVEDKPNWCWFLERLKNDLGIVNTTPWTVMSDKQKGLINAVNELFPDSEHRFCVRHMWKNFQQTFKGDALKNQLWKIARSTTVVNYELYMAQMKELNLDAYNWLHNLEPNTWVKAWQSDLPKCDILINNNCEVFNKYILDARELPILSMFERIKEQLMTRHYTKQIEAEKMQGTVCPKIKKKIEELKDLANTAYVQGSGDKLFQVGDRGVDYIVDLKTRTCTCCRWQKSGIPCHHVLAVCRLERKDPHTYVDECYYVSRFKKAYSNIIYPCKDKTEWEKMNGPPIEPPNYQKHVGRPCKSRRKSPEEIICGGGGKRMSRHGVIMHCSYCKEPDHNKNGCKYLKAVIPPPSANVQVPTQENGQPEAQNGTDNVEIPVRNEDQNPSANTSSQPIVEDLMISHMIQQRPPPRVIERTPVPHSHFLTAAQAMLNESQRSSNTVTQSELTKQLLLLKNQREKELEDKKQSLLLQRMEAEQKKAEELARKKHEQTQKKALDAEKRRLAAAEIREKKKQETALYKQARAQAKQFVTEANKEALAKQKAAQEAQRKAQRDVDTARKQQEKLAAAAQKEEQRKAIAAEKEAQRQANAAEKEARRIAVAEEKEAQRIVAAAQREAHRTEKATNQKRAGKRPRNQYDTSHNQGSQAPKHVSMFDIFR